MLLVAVSWSLLRGSAQGMLWSAIGGLLLDLLSSAPFGLHAAAMVSVGFLAGLGQTNVFRLSLALPLLVVAIATLCYDLVLVLGLWLAGTPIVWADFLLRVVAPSVIVNMAFMPIVFLAVRWMHKRTGPAEISW